MLVIPPPNNNVDLVTSMGVAGLALLGGIAKGQQWRDSKTGGFSLGLMLSGIATALIMATVVRAAGTHYGVEPWIQVAGSGVLCYVGPDPILRGLAGLAMKYFDLNTEDDHAGKE